MLYHKINSLFKRDMDGNKKLIIDDWSQPEFEFLKNNQWVFTEKVDGTNIRVHYAPNGHDVRYGGRTDNAQIPPKLEDKLDQLFKSDYGRERLALTFASDAFAVGEYLTLYGEGYGGKIQSGGKYKQEPDFVLFDVRIGNWWLQRHNVEDIAQKIGIPVVPIVGEGTLYDAIDMVKFGLQSRWGAFEAEGVVARPKVELTTRQGHRIITKIKGIDFK